jgi:hypothetical protein
VILIGVVAAAVMAVPARAVQIDKTEIDLVIDPNSESMTAQVRLHVTDNTGNQPLVCYFLKPTRLDYVREAASGRSVPYQFQQLSLPEYGVFRFTMSLGRVGRECILELGYAYSGRDFYGYSLNPTTLDNLVFGQITRQSVYSSHLAYYPYTDGLTGRGSDRPHRAARVDGRQCGGPEGGVSRRLSRFVYDIPYPSGLLFLP